MQKVAVQGQAVFRALLGVKLRGKNIIARNGCGEYSAVVCLSGTVRCALRASIEAVHEVKVTVVRNSSPHRVDSATVGQLAPSLLPDAGESEILSRRPVVRLTRYRPEPLLAAPNKPLVPENCAPSTPPVASGVPMAVVVPVATSIE